MNELSYKKFVEACKEYNASPTEKRFEKFEELWKDIGPVRKKATELFASMAQKGYFKDPLQEFLTALHREYPHVNLFEGEELSLSFTRLMADCFVVGSFCGTSLIEDILRRANEIIADDGGPKR